MTVSCNHCSVVVTTDEDIFTHCRKEHSAIISEALQKINTQLTSLSSPDHDAFTILHGLGLTSGKCNSRIIMSVKDVGLECLEVPATTILALIDGCESNDLQFSMYPNGTIYMMMSGFVRRKQNAVTMNVLRNKAQINNMLSIERKQYRNGGDELHHIPLKIRTGSIHGVHDTKDTGLWMQMKPALLSGGNYARMVPSNPRGE